MPLGESRYSSLSVVKTVELNHPPPSKTLPGFTSVQCALPSQSLWDDRDASRTLKMASWCMVNCNCQYDGQIQLDRNPLKVTLYCTLLGILCSFEHAQNAMLGTYAGYSMPGGGWKFTTNCDLHNFWGVLTTTAQNGDTRQPRPHNMPNLQ